MTDKSDDGVPKGRAPRSESPRQKPERTNFQKLAFLPDDEVEALLGQLPPDKQAEFRDKFIRNHPIFSLERADYRYTPPEDGRERRLKGYINFERGDAVAILPFDAENRKVLLLQQVRTPLWAKTETGWLVETVAGMPKEDPNREGWLETHLDCAIRELKEETGIDLSGRRGDVFPLDEQGIGAEGVRIEEEGQKSTRGLLVPSRDRARHNFYPSPGGSSEQIHVFLARTPGAAETTPPYAGKAEEDEFTVLKWVAIDEFFALAHSGYYEDSKIYVAAQLLSEEVKRLGLQQDIAHIKPILRTRMTCASSGETIGVGVLPGDVAKHAGRADVWVNSEDPSLRMDRFISRSFSSTVRRLGAVWFDQKSQQGALLSDTIADALRIKRKGEPAVTSAFLTTSGSLLPSHEVRALVHVVAVIVDPETSAQRHQQHRTREMTMSALEAVAAANRRRFGFRPYRRVVLPMFGAGQAGGDISVIVPMVIDGVEAFFASRQRSGITEVYLSGYGVETYLKLRDELAKRASPNWPGEARYAELTEEPTS